MLNKYLKIHQTANILPLTLFKKFSNILGLLQNLKNF